MSSRRLAWGLLLAAGCGPVPRVDFAAAPSLEAAPDPQARPPWNPRYARDYRRVRDRWTRRAKIINDWDTALDARITLASSELRAAYVRMVAGMRGLPDADRLQLAEQQRKDGSDFVELWVAMETSKWEWNDLTSTRSVWTVSLFDEQGRALESSQRSQLAGKPAELDRLFPAVSPFTLVWRVRFPARFSDGTPVLRPGLRKLSARFAGPLGHAEVSWESS